MKVQFRVWDSISKQMHSREAIKDIPLSKFELEHYNLMQYVGLKDKNGKQYCENDIVLFEGKRHRLMKGTYAFFLLGFFKASQDNPHNFFSEDAFEKAEIVGNIHEDKL